MSIGKRYKVLRRRVKQIIAYPTSKTGRRTSDGYPTEFTYDEFAYKRMVDSYRKALRKALRAAAAAGGET